MSIGPIRCTVYCVRKLHTTTLQYSFDYDCVCGNTQLLSVIRSVRQVGSLRKQTNNQTRYQCLFIYVQPQPSRSINGLNESPLFYGRPPDQSQEVSLNICLLGSPSDRWAVLGTTRWDMSRNVNVRVTGLSRPHLPLQPRQEDAVRLLLIKCASLVLVRSAAFVGLFRM